MLPLLDVAVGASGWPTTSAAVNADAARPVPVPGAFSSSRHYLKIMLGASHKVTPGVTSWLHQNFD